MYVCIYIYISATAFTNSCQHLNIECNSNFSKILPQIGKRETSL